ncbi:MAG: hypothetical protein Q8S36_10490 [Sulfuricurvum sp.]|nr:hypothetical protein [Sulfuricurvum sp.]
MRAATINMTSAFEGAILSAKVTGEPQDYVDLIEMLIEYIGGFKNG